jgi:hypothetical protein
LASADSKSDVVTITKVPPPPTVTFTPAFTYVPMGGEITVQVDISQGPVTLAIEPVGLAAFVENGREENELELPTSRSVTIRGIGVSSTVNDVRVVVKYPASEPPNQSIAQQPFSAVAIQKVEWLDANGNRITDPNSHPTGTVGFRVFPDATAVGGAAQDKVKVQATITPAVSGVTVFFRSIDVDDPSADMLPVDDDFESVIPSAQDNRGLPKDGQFVGTNGANQTSKTTTVTSGVASATVDFQVTMQPGDNFRVVATCIDQNQMPQPAVDLNRLEAEQLSVRIASVKDGAGNVIANDLTTPATLKASDVLTVWRKLHVERDSMEAIPPSTDPETNTVIGVIIGIEGDAATGVATRVFVNQNLDDGSPRLDNSNDPTSGRFENGVISVGDLTMITPTGQLRGNGRDSNGRNYVERSAGNGGINVPFLITKSGVSGTVIGRVWRYVLSTNTFSVRVTGMTPLTSAYVDGEIDVAGVVMRISSIPDDQTVVVQQIVDIPFLLLDDDGQNLLPDFPDTSLMPEIFDSAYILPAVDGGGSEGNNTKSVAFDLNVTTTSEMNAIMGPAFQSANNRNDNYWIVWVLMAHQPNPDPRQPIADNVSDRADQDPDTEVSLVALGTPDGNGSNLLQSGIEQSGAFIFIETLRDHAKRFGRSTSDQERPTVVHELGHSFGLPDRIGGTGIMSDSFPNPLHWLLTPQDIEIVRKRVKSPGIYR